MCLGVEAVGGAWGVDEGVGRANKAPGTEEVAGGIPLIDLVSKPRPPESSRGGIFSASSCKRTKSSGWRRGGVLCSLGAETFL